MVLRRFLLEINNETVVMTEDYQDFIQRLRLRLGVRFSHNVRALAVQSDDPVFCDVLIETDVGSVRFRLRNDNIYLIGYQMRGGQWLEFNRSQNNSDHLIPNSEFLGFTCTYISMSSPRAGNQSLSQTSISLYGLGTAVDTLATSEIIQERAQSLMVVIFMICEAARFVPITEHIANHTEFRIPRWMQQMVHSWGVFSGALFRADADPDEPFTIPEGDVLVIRDPPSPERRISTIADIVSILGLLLGLCYTQPAPSMSLRMTMMSREHEQCFVGIPLLEVYSVTINYITGQDTGHLMTGAITISNGLFERNIYNRSKNYPEPIQGFDEVELTGPFQPLTAFGNVSIILVLLLNDTTLPLTFIDETISWDAFNLGTPYDRRISVPLDSPQGSATVNYAVLRNAVAARVIVTLKEAYESSSEVFGRVYAYYEDWEDPIARIWLFHNRPPDYISVDRGHNVPLLRSVVAVPLYGNPDSSNTLIIRVELMEYDSMSSNDVIVRQTFKFPIPDRLPSATFKDSTEEGGNVVRVTVSWTSGYNNE